MDTQENQTKNVPTPAPVSSSCRKHVKDENATFFADLKDHINEIVNTSMDEHKTCIQNTINKVFEGISKAVEEKKDEPKEVESPSSLKAVEEEKDEPKEVESPSSLKAAA